MAITDEDYEGSFRIPAPKGIYQGAGDTNISPEYAYIAENIRTERGLLASSYGTSSALPPLGEPIGTLARFYRRTRPDDPEIFVAAAGGGIYTYTEGTEGWVQRGSGFESDRWSYVTYETEENGETVDVLLLSNAADGMAVIYGSDLRVERRILAIGDEYGEVRFAVLGRYAERIWGTGAPGYPDSIFYSRPYAPLDWTADEETPEMGGGVINQPTWDGQSFISLAGFGGYLLAIKPGTVYEIRGTDPSSFTITQAYGTDGPVEAETICVDGTKLFYLSEGGIGLYDGSAIRLLTRDALYETMRRLHGREGAAACVCDHVYYLAVCLWDGEGEAPTQNNAVIEYDTERETFMLRTGLSVKDFYALGGEVYYTQADMPYGVMRYADPKASGYSGQPIKSVWETPWLDLGKEYRKSDFLLRFTAEADEEEYPLTLRLETEKKEKTKVVMLGRRRRDYRVRMQAKGLRVRLRLETGERAGGFRIYGGIQVNYTMEAE